MVQPSNTKTFYIRPPCYNNPADLIETKRFVGAAQHFRRVFCSSFINEFRLDNVFTITFII